MSALSIYFVSVKRARDKSNWSGIPYHVFTNLSKKGILIKDISGIRRKYLYVNYLRKLWVRFHGLNMDINRSKSILKALADTVEAKALNSDPVIFSIGSLPLTYLKSPNKKIIYTDCTFQQVLDYYPAYSNLDKKNIDDGNRHEYMALHNADKIIYTSEWAARSAIDFYRIPGNKIVVIPFGPNLEYNPGKQERERIQQTRRESPEFRVLFVGMDWKRKGGDMAFEIFKCMAGKFSTLSFDIVSNDVPPEVRNHEKVIFHGALDKNDPDQEKKLIDIYSQSSVLLLPTMADCTPVVIAEANMFGIPALCTDTGGISSIVKNGINGFLFEQCSPVEEWIKPIEQLISSKNFFADISESSFDYFEKHFSWEVVASKIAKVISEV